jgi:hypothetical protein
LGHGSGIFNYDHGDKFDGSFDKDERHGIGEYRWAEGSIFKGSWANDKRNGIGFEWFRYGDFYQGTFKDNKRDGLFIIHEKASENTADAEYKDDFIEGL